MSADISQEIMADKQTVEQYQGALSSALVAARDALIAKLCDALKKAANALESEIESERETAWNDIRNALEATPESASAELAELRVEVARLKAGGCARDQRTTQYCAEAAAMAKELAALREDKARWDALEAVPYGMEIIIYRSVSKCDSKPSIRKQVDAFIERESEESKTP